MSVTASELCVQVGSLTASRIRPKPSARSSTDAGPLVLTEGRAPAVKKSAAVSSSWEEWIACRAGVSDRMAMSAHLALRAVSAALAPGSSRWA